MAIVIGAGRTIEEEISIVFAREGASVAVNDVVAEEAERVDGAIVNIGSTSVHWGRNALAYCAAKDGVLNLTRAMTVDLAP